MARVNVTGDKKLLATLRRLPDEIKRQVQKSRLPKAADLTKDRAQELAPMATGRLRDSIRIVETTDGVEITSEIYYAIYVEFGTSKTAPVGFMTNAADDTAHKIPRVIASNMQGDINAAVRKAR